MNTTSKDLREKFGDRDLDLTAFEHDVSVHDWAERYRAGQINLGPLFFSPFAELTPSHLKAAAHTDTNLIQPSVVITDTSGTPYAGFDMTDTPSRQPGVSVHFIPSDYGITQPSSYVITFYVDSVAGVRLQTGVNAGVTVNRPNSDSRTGPHSITFTFVNLPPTQPVYADVTQTRGTQWSWYRTAIGYPPLILTTEVLHL